MKDHRITVRAILLGLLASAGFAWYTVVTENLSTGRRILTATQIPVLPYLLLIACVVLINPLARRLRVIRALSSAEVMVIFIMTMVSAGVSTFGLASPLVPVIGGLFNRDWNTVQARWDRYIQPFVNETYFISEPGIREASQRSLDAENAWRDADAVLRAARLLDRSRDAVRDAERQVNAPEETLSRAARQRWARILAMERERLAAVETRWAPYADVWAVESVLETFPERVAALQETWRLRRDELAAIEAQAFDRVELFRKGLPRPLRAVPGLLPTADERAAVYWARLQRTGAGLRAVRELRAARETARSADGAAQRAAIRDRVRQAADRWQAVADRNTLLARRNRLQERRATLETAIVESRREIEHQRDRRRYADADDVAVIDRDIASQQSGLDGFLADLAAIDGEISESVDPRLRLAEESADIRMQILELDARLADGLADGPAIAAAIGDIEQAIRALDVSWRVLLAGNVPWRQWRGPLARWGVLTLLAYIMLMTFNVLIFRQWAHHEKLVYPLAELPMQLGGVDPEAGGEGEGRVPPVYRGGLFWAGVAVSAMVLGWNILATRRIVPGISPIPLRFDWTPYIDGSIFSGLQGPSHHHQVFFTLIGISFLVPARISKSLWSFHLVYMLLLLCLVWLGYGENERSFSASMSLALNFRTALGGGALIAFSVMTLWKCRRYLFCGVSPRGLDGLASAERTELRVSSWGFMVSSVLLIGILTYGMGANLFFAIFCYLVIMIVTIGMVRAVAEGGLLVFQCWFNPFHIIRSTVGMHRAWTASSLLAPLVIFYYVLFWDLKTFIAPAMANTLKIRDSLGLRRLGFHAAVWLGIGVAMITALATHIIMGYHRGANSMHDWFYQSGPRNHLFGWIKDMAIANPVDPTRSGWWMLAGLIVMTLLLVLRRRRLWLPHPIGLVMWVNPVMWAFWFSILLGWAFKTVVSRYGDRASYLRFRDFFIGLIVGELLMCLFGVDLNRN